MKEFLATWWTELASISSTQRNMTKEFLIHSKAQKTGKTPCTRNKEKTQRKLRGVGSSRLEGKVRLWHRASCPIRQQLVIRDREACDMWLAWAETSRESNLHTGCGRLSTSPQKSLICFYITTCWNHNLLIIFHSGCNMLLKWISSSSV